MSKYNKGKRKPVIGNHAKEVTENIDTNNPVLQMFQTFAALLDEKHDRHERIVKLSRDITIESKRIIFLLHGINTEIESKKNSVLQEAETRLAKLCSTNFKAIALELKNEDHYQHHRAFTAGMQEFIEAMCFFHYIKHDDIESWGTINKFFQFSDENEAAFNLLFTQFDFILGIGDFTGELMRRCINHLGSGHLEECFKICDYVKKIHSGFLGISYTGNRDISRKAYVLRQSLTKMELVCYNIQIRGSEIPKHMLINVLENDDGERVDDEGFCI